MSGPQAGEPTLADVQQEYPAWECLQGVSGFYYAEHTPSGTQVSGEDPLDLRDQVKAAEARLACQQELGAPAPGPTGML